MKNMMKKIGLAIVLVIAFAVSYSFLPIQESNNGVDVEVVKYDGQIALGIRCDGIMTYYPAESGTVLYKNGVISLWNYKVRLPEGNCRIPSGEEGDYDVYAYSSAVGSWVRLKFTPSGLVILKYPVDLNF